MELVELPRVTRRGFLKTMYFAPVGTGVVYSDVLHALHLAQLPVVLLVTMLIVERFKHCLWGTAGRLVS